jgi:CRISPR system Cascade subunit CasE
MLNGRSREVRRDLADCHELHRTILRGFPDLSEGSGAGGDARARLGVLFRLETDERSGAARVLVQSRVAPDWGRLPAGYVLESGGGQNPEQKEVGEAFAAIRTGDELLFRLRANPTKRLPPTTGADGVRRDGKRVELRTEAELLAWLAEKGTGNPATGRPGAGFRVVTVRAQPGVPVGERAEPAGRGGRVSGGAGDRVRMGAAVADAQARRVGKVTGQALRPGNGGVEAGGGAGGTATRRRLTFGDVVFDGRLVVTDAALFRATLERGIGSGKAFGFGLLSVARSRG